MSTTITGEGLWKAFTNPNMDILFISVSERISEELLGRVYDWINSMPRLLKPKLEGHSVQASKSVIKLLNGSRIISLPNSPDTIRGFGMRPGRTDVYADEFAWIENDVELWTVIRDFVILGGNVTIISTPAGKQGLFFKIAYPLQVKYRGREDPSLANMTLSETGTQWPWSYHEIPYEMRPELKAQEGILRAETDEIHFRQEYMTEFIDESISMFPYGLILPCAKLGDQDLFPLGYKSYNPIFFGQDFAKKRDEAVLFIVEKMAGGHFRVLWYEVLSPPRTTFEQQLSLLELMDKKFNPQRIKIDSTGMGEPLAETLIKNIGSKIDGINFSSREVREKLITDLRILFEQRKISIPKNQKLLDQLNGIRREVTEGGNIKFTSDESHDDMVYALALAVLGELDLTDKGQAFAAVIRDEVQQRYSKTPNDEGAFAELEFSEGESDSGVILD
jgi:phage FluMu gp28-like protein